MTARQRHCHHSCGLPPPYLGRSSQFGCAFVGLGQRFVAVERLVQKHLIKLYVSLRPSAIDDRRAQSFGH